MKRREFFKQAGGVALAGALASSARPVTAQAPAESFCFCVAADPHCLDGPTKGIEDLGTGADRFMRCVAAIEQLPAEDRPDFLLVAGDLHVRAFLPLIKDVPIPVHVTAGNHESSPDDRKALREAFPGDFALDGKPSDYYSFVHKNARFISVCDAGLGGEHIGVFCSENIRPRGQCEWIEEQLSMPEPVRILFTHIPTERNGEDQEMHVNRNDSRWFNALVQRTKPTALFFGHLHSPTEEYRIEETRVWQVRSCCWNIGAAPIGFLHVRVDPAGLTVREVITGTPA